MENMPCAVHGMHLTDMPRGEEFATIAEVFKLLGDASRIRLFWLLCHGEGCVLNLAAMMEMSSPAVSHHLKLLKEKGLVTCHREGKEMIYRAADTPLTQALHVIIEQVVSITCPGVHK